MPSSYCKADKVLLKKQMLQCVHIAKQTVLGLIKCEEYFSIFFTFGLKKDNTGLKSGNKFSLVFLSDT